MQLEMKRQVNTQNDDMDTQTSDSAHLEKERKAYPEDSRRAIGDKCIEHRADVKCTYKCTDLEDDQCDCKCNGEMMR
jgi:hypothetical protein